MRNPLRQHFRALDDAKHVYLDFAATALVAQPVVDAIALHLQKPRGNPWRGAHAWSEDATRTLEQARENIAKYIGATNLIFTKNTTEGLNMLAFGFGCKLSAGDEVLLSIFDHHSVLVPWQEAAKRYGFTLVFAGMTKDGQLDSADAEKKISHKTKAIVISHVSNVLGVALPLDQMIGKAKKYGAYVFLDAAQSIGRLPVDLKQMEIDAIAFSAHKMYGPMGIGALAVSDRLLAVLEPMLFGGGAMDGVKIASGLQKFAAGTPSLDLAVGFATAIDFVKNNADQKHDEALRALVHESLKELPNVVVHGPSYSTPGLPIVSFSIHGFHPHDVAAYLSEQGVYARSGFHCAAPLAACLHPQGTVRLSAGLPTDVVDIQRCIEVLRDLAE